MRQCDEGLRTCVLKALCGEAMTCTQDTRQDIFLLWKL